MDSVKAIIAQHSKRYEEFKEYFSLIEEIERNALTKPDICIESCKSLIEGISKPILKHLDTALVDDKHIDGIPAAKVFARAMTKLAEYDADIHLDIIDKLKAAFETIINIRNKRGEISHGKISPKLEVSDTKLAAFVMHTTEGLAHYMLSVFYGIDLSYKAVIVYDDHPEFNDYLDEENPLSGKVKYSKALYEQTPEDYELFLEEWAANKEDETA